MADLEGDVRGLSSAITSNTGQLADGVDIALKTRFQGLGNFPADMNNLENMADYLAHLQAGTLPAVLQRFVNDLTVAIMNTPGLSTSNIVFPMENTGKPFSLEFLTASPYVRDAITGDATGITMDRTVGQDPQQIDALGGIANRAELRVSRGVQTNWRRVIDLTFQIASLGAGGSRPFMAWERRAAPGSVHNVFFLRRASNTNENVVLQARVMNPANPAQQGTYTLGVGTRTGASNVAHFQVGNIVRMVMEFEKPNPSGTDAEQNLRVIITAHRLNNNMQIIETIQFDDLSVISSSDADTANRGRILGKINFFSYDELYLYPEDAGGNYILPMIGVEGWQWVDTLSPRDFLHHQELADRSRTPVSADYRLLGFWQQMMSDLFTLHAPITIIGKAALGQDSSFKDKDDNEVTFESLRTNKLVEKVVDQAINQQASNFTQLAANTALTGDADDLYYVEVYDGNTFILSGTFQLSDYTAATATETALTGNPLNRGRAFFTRATSAGTFYLAKAPNGRLRVNSSSSGDTFNLKITKTKSQVG